MNGGPDTASSGSRLLAALSGLPEAERLAHLRAEPDPEAALIALGDEVQHLAAVEVARALAAAEMVDALAETLGSPRARSRVLSARALAFAQAGRFTEALPCAAEAVAVAEAAGLVVYAARARLASLQALASLGRYDEALTAGNAARDALVAAGEPVLAARADLNLGAVHQERDAPRDALRHLDRARPTLADDPALLAQLESNRGNALMSLDDFAGAEVAFNAAVPALVEFGMEWAAAVAEGNLAYLAMRQGRLQRALYHFERARRYLEVDEAPTDLARLRAEEADALVLLGLPEEAVATYEAVLPELITHGLAPEAAQAQSGLGRALLLLDRAGPADDALLRAAAAFDALGNATARARVDLIRADLLFASGRLDEARTLTADALDAMRDRPADAVLARVRLARLALAAGDFAAADADLAVAVPAAEGLDLAPTLADALHLRGRLRLARGRPGGAADLRAAVRQVERIRGTLHAERFRAALLGDRLALYEDAVVAALDQDDDTGTGEAFALVEQAKSRALLDLIAGALDPVDDDDPAAIDAASSDPEVRLRAELAQRRAELNWRYSRFAEDLEPEAGDPDERRAAVRALEREIATLQSRIASARGIEGLYAPPADLPAIQRLIAADGALVEYFVANGRLIAFVVRADRVRVWSDLGAADDLTALVRRVHFQIGRALAGAPAVGPRADRLLVDIRRELGALHDRLLAPMADALAEVRQIVFVPHGVLHALPFHALWDSERTQHLIERVEVRYAPSTSLLVRIATDAPRERGSAAVVVGVPDAAAPRIAEETARVATSLAGADVLLGPEATADRVLARLRRPADVVHLACHGRFALDTPLAAGIKLADRWLTVRDVYALRLDAELVTLSGCETGRTLVGGGDELTGLLSGFYAAGAASLLVSLWTVNDDSAADLMTAFYDRWRSGASKPAALRAAQLGMLHRRPHPAFWAPFVLGGTS